MSTPSLAVAYSGGLDSAALLHAASAYCKEHGIKLYAFHVHHGLSANADMWLAHCDARAAALGAVFEARRVSVKPEGSGTEASARKARYAALGEMCRAHGVPLLLTAHHLDDQAETVLLQLLRGSGPAGMSGMDASNKAESLLGDAVTVIARPLLDVTRAELAAYVQQHAIEYVDDESNADARFARNALRHQVMPALEQAFPGYQQRFARAAAHAQSAQRLLAEMGEQDLAACLVGEAIDCVKLRAMSADRAANMLRHWFHVRGIAMPSTAWLHEMLVQAVEARYETQMLVTHPECLIRRHRDRLFITPKLAPLAAEREPGDDYIPPAHPFKWNGEASIAFPAYGGTLHIEQAEEGIDADWLRGQQLEMSFRRGGERVKPAHNRPTKALKYHYQALDIPAWERTRLPIVHAGIHLLYAAGIGMDYHYMTAHPGVVFRWTSN
ncbi:tRNA lysidine(34) synthetase TilS [Pseudoduganella sp. GCM10020061]|uniref:tRNA lysidine(34) synthetase TilS n=1 Tax=Pseudoduganella sp. GCM10020061 TaxID=3317345 RepID=UPI003638B52E